MAMDPVIQWSFLGIGIFGQGLALALARRPIALSRAGGKATGTVTGSDAEVVSGKGSPRTYHFPHVAFTTTTGEKISFKSTTGSGTALPTGTVVPVIYDPANPRDASIRSMAALWILPIAACVLSLPFLIVGLMGLFSR